MITKAAHNLRDVLLVMIPLVGIAWLLHLPFLLGFSIVGAAYLMFMAGAVTAVALLSSERTGASAWIDLVLAIAAISCWSWGAWHHESWLVSFTLGPEKWLPGVIALATLIEALRRTCGMAISIVVLLCLAYAFFGHHAPGIVQGAYTSPPRLVVYLYNDTNGVPGVVLGVAATIVLAFILMGRVMSVVGASEFFTDLAMSTMGHRRGGPAKVAVLASSLFGTISGSTLGNIMTTGVITIPLMKRSGFPRHTAGAVEAVASNGGQLAPPVMGATAFLIAEFLQVPYSEVVLAAALPAFLYFLVLFLQIDAIAVRLNLTKLDKSELPVALKVLRDGWPYILPLAYLIYLLFFRGTAPETSALYATLAMLAAGALVMKRVPGMRTFYRILHGAGQTLIPILLICAAAGIVIGTLNITGLGFLLTNALAHVGASMGLMAMLMLTALIAIFLGMGMPTAAVYIVLSIILAPALIRMGIPPMAAHLFIFYFGLLSMITPPVAIATYAAGAIAEADMWATGLAGLRLGIAAYFLPFLFCYNPALIGEGSITEILLVVANSSAAGYLLALAMARLERFSMGRDAIPLAVLCMSALGLVVAGQILGTAHPVSLVAMLGLPAIFYYRQRVSAVEQPLPS